MVYNVSYAPTDMPNILTDFFAEFFVQGRIFVAVIIVMLLLIFLVRAIKR